MIIGRWVINQRYPGDEASEGTAISLEDGMKNFYSGNGLISTLIAEVVRLRKEVETYSKATERNKSTIEENWPAQSVLVECRCGRGFIVSNRLVIHRKEDKSTIIDREGV